MTRLHYASTKDSDMLYLVRQRIADPFFFLELDGKKRIFLGSTDIEAFKAESDGSVEAIDVDPLRREAAGQSGDILGNLALLILNKYNVTDEIHVPSSFPVAIADAVREKIPRLTVVATWCPERMVKSDEEVGYIKENFEHTKKAFEFVEQVLWESRIEGDTIINDGQILTSEWLKREVLKLLLDHDLENTESLIISCGKHAAMPHHQGCGPLRPHETIIVDLFPQSSTNHYFADMTRTYVKGEANEETTKMYEAVATAQRAALEALRPGMAGVDAFEVSAQVIREAGFDVGEKGYIHGLGHGLGVAIHEAPNLGPRSETVLEPGHVVTVEPGLYYPERGGVRIEDTVVITENGCENLTNYPQNWRIS